MNALAPLALLVACVPLVSCGGSGGGSRDEGSRDADAAGPLIATGTVDPAGPPDELGKVRSRVEAAFASYDRPVEPGLLEAQARVLLAAGARRARRRSLRRRCPACTSPRTVGK